MPYKFNEIFDYHLRTLFYLDNSGPQGLSIISREADLPWVEEEYQKCYDYLSKTIDKDILDCAFDPTFYALRRIKEGLNTKDISIFCWFIIYHHEKEITPLCV